MNQLNTWLESDQPRAAAELQERIRALDAYLAIAVPEELRAGGAGSGDTTSVEDVEPKPFEKKTTKDSTESQDIKQDDDE